MIPAVFFTFHVTLLFGPPSVKRSISELFRHSAACRFLFGSREYPATQVWSLILFPPLLVPPSPGRFDTLYWVFLFGLTWPCACAGTKATQTKVTIMKRSCVTPLVVCCAIRFFVV